jgi:hypothetical protein
MRERIRATIERLERCFPFPATPAIVRLAKWPRYGVPRKTDLRTAP